MRFQILILTLALSTTIGAQSAQAAATDILKVAQQQSPRGADLVVALQPNVAAADCRIYFEDEPRLADVTIEPEEIFSRADIIVAEQFDTKGADITVAEESVYRFADIRVHGTHNLILAAAACPRD
jgi:hypothetical protein